MTTCLHHFDGQRYALDAYVVMPNHVHVLVAPGYEQGGTGGLPVDSSSRSLSAILHTWKSFTSKAINRKRGSKGVFWMDESFDHAVRSEKQRQHFRTYIREMPAKAFLKGEQRVMLREAAASEPRKSRVEKSSSSRAKTPESLAALDSLAQVRFAALKAWRAEVAREHALPAYVIFHDATLLAMAQAAPQSMDELSGISGLGAKKLEAYGQEVLRLLRDDARQELQAA